MRRRNKQPGSSIQTRENKLSSSKRVNSVEECIYIRVESINYAEREGERCVHCNVDDIGGPPPPSL